jgi:hypothetical protein
MASSVLEALNFAVAQTGVNDGLALTSNAMMMSSFLGPAALPAAFLIDQMNAGGNGNAAPPAQNNNDNTNLLRKFLEDQEALRNQAPAPRPANPPRAPIAPLGGNRPFNFNGGP